MSLCSLRAASRFVAIMALITLTGAAAAMSRQPKAEENPEADLFDYYVLALSWSPSYCEQEGDGRDSPQCSARASRERDYGFVVHGLWPQYERGWPQDCGKAGWLGDDLIRDQLDMIPAKGAVIHQWRKHGVCSGLEPKAYFDKTREAYEAVRIPAPLRKLDQWIDIRPGVIEEAFIKANPDYKPDGVTVTCRGKRLREVRICLTHDLEPRLCGKDVRRDCRDKSVRMPPIR